MNLEFAPIILSATIAGIGALLLRSFDAFANNITSRLEKLEESVDKAMTSVTELIVKQQVDQAEIHQLRQRQERLDKEFTTLHTTIKKCKACNE